MCTSTKPPAHTLCIDSDRLGYRPFPHYGGTKNVTKTELFQSQGSSTAKKGVAVGLSICETCNTCNLRAGGRRCGSCVPEVYAMRFNRCGR
jgi:uncharacterized paraquat-inducible protein A